MLVFKNDLSLADLELAGKKLPQTGKLKRTVLKFAQVLKTNPYRGRGGEYTTKARALPVGQTKELTGDEATDAMGLFEPPKPKLKAGPKPPNWLMAALRGRP